MALLVINNFGPSFLKNDTESPSRTPRSTAVRCCKCNYFAQPTFHELFQAEVDRKCSSSMKMNPLLGFSSTITLSSMLGSGGVCLLS